MVFVKYRLSVKVNVSQRKSLTLQHYRVSCTLHVMIFNMVLSKRQKTSTNFVKNIKFSNNSSGTQIRMRMESINYDQHMNGFGI